MLGFKGNCFERKNNNIKCFLHICMNLLITIIAAFISALGLWVFVYESNFAPAGIDGIATMLQEITTINAGIFSLILNIPLLVLAWFFLKHKYVIYTLVFTTLNSIFIFLFENFQLFQYQGNQILAAIFSGAILGIRTGLMLRIGASSGGVDVLACIFQVKTNNKYVEKFISLICYIIIGVSIFVYKDIECVLMSIVQMFIFEKAISAVLIDTRNAVEVKIITKEPEDIKNILLYEFKHGATIINAKGGFTGEDKNVIYSIINRRQLSEFLNVIKKYPNTFVCCSDIEHVYGNFRWMKNDEVK